MEQTDTEEKEKAKQKLIRKMMRERGNQSRDSRRLTSEEYNRIYARRFCGKALSDIFRSVTAQIDMLATETRRAPSTKDALKVLSDDLQKLVPENGWPDSGWLERINDVLRHSIKNELRYTGLMEEKILLSEEQLTLLVQLANPISDESHELYERTYCSTNNNFYSGPERRSVHFTDRRTVATRRKESAPKP